MIPLDFFAKIAKLSSEYYYNDWVLENIGNDRDGNPKAKSHFVDCPTYTCEKATPERQHRANKEKNKYNITSGFIICWIAILIINDAHFGVEKRGLHKLWRRSPYELSIPYIQNTMTIK